MIDLYNISRIIQAQLNYSTKDLIWLPVSWTSYNLMRNADAKSTANMLGVAGLTGQSHSMNG